MFTLKWLIVLSVLNNARASGVEENNTKSESDTEEALKPDTLRSKREPYHDYLHYLIEKHAQCADQHLTPLRPDGLFKPYDMLVYPYGLSQSRAEIARQSHQMQNVPGLNIFPTYHNPLKPSEYATRRPASNKLANLLNFASPSYLKIPDCDSNRSSLGFKNQPRYKGQQRTGGTKSQRKFKPSRKSKKPITTSLDPILERGSSSKNSSQVVIVNVNVNNCKSMKDSIKSGRSGTKDLKNLSNKAKPENSTYLCSSCLANSKANRTDSVSRYNIDSVKFPCSSCAARSGDSIKGMIRTNDTVTRNTSVSPASREQKNSGGALNSANPEEDTYSSLAPYITSSSERRNKANGLQINDESVDTTPYPITATTKELKSSRPYASTPFPSTKTDLSNSQTEISDNNLNPYPVTTPLPIAKLSKDTNINFQPEVSPKDPPVASLVPSQDTILETIEARPLDETTTVGVQELLGEDLLNTEAIAKQNRPEKGFSSKSDNGILQKEAVATNFNTSGGNTKPIETPTDHFGGISNHTGIKPNSKSSKGLVTKNNGSNNLDEEAIPSKFNETSRENDLNRNNTKMKSNGQHEGESQDTPETFPAELGNEFADHNATTQRPADIINIPVQNNGKFEIIQLPQNVAGSKPGSVRQELDKFLNDGNKHKQDSNIFSSNEQLGPGENIQPESDKRPNQDIELRLTSNSSQQGHINFGTGSVPHQKDQSNVVSTINDQQSTVSDIETTINNDEPEESTRSVSSFLKDPQTTTVSEATGRTLSKSKPNESTEFVQEPKEFVSHGFVLDAYQMGKGKLPMKPKDNIEDIDKLLKIGSSKPLHSQREGEKILAIVKNQQRESLEAISNSNEHRPAEFILNAREKEDSLPHDQRELLELISESKSEGHHVFPSNLHRPGLDRDKSTRNITGSVSSKPTSSSQLNSLSRKEQQIPVEVIYETNEGDGDVLPSNSTVSEAIEPILDSHGQAEVKLFTFSSKNRNKPVSGISIANVIRGKGNATFATPSNETEHSELFNPSQENSTKLDSKDFGHYIHRQADVKLAVLSETNPIQRKITLEMPEFKFLTESNKAAAISSESFENVDIGGESFSTKTRQVPAEIISEENQQPPVDSQENVRLSTIVNENWEGNSSLGDKENRQSTEKVFSFSKIKDRISSNDAETDVGKIPNSHFTAAVKLSSFAKTKQIESGHVKTEGEVKHISFSRGRSQEPHGPLAHSDINERTRNLQDHIQGALNLFSSNSKNDHGHSTLPSNSNIQGSIKHFTFRHKNKQDSSGMAKDEAQTGKPLEGAVKIVSFSISKQQEPKAGNGREAIDIKKDNIIPMSSPNADRSSKDSNIKWPWIFNSQANRAEQVGHLFNSGFKEANINDHSALENESTKSRPTDMTGTDTKFIKYMQIPKGRSLINEPIITEIYPGRRSKSRSPPSIYWHTIEPRTEAIARTIKELRPFMSPDFEDVRDDFDNDSKESLDYDEIYDDEDETRLRPNFPDLINVKNIQ